MSIFNRMSTIIKSRMNTLMDKVEDPSETLDYSYQKQLELLQNVRRGLAEVATSKKRLELQKAKLQQSVDKLDLQAKEAVKSGNDDLARRALERKVALQAQITGLEEQIKELEDEKDKLAATENRLSTKIEVFRTKKETLKAQYSAAEAQTKVKESVTGISEEMADVGLAIQRSEEKIERMRARSGALDELIEEGSLEDLTGEDDIEKELLKIRSEKGVESELARLKEEAGK